MYCIEVVLDYKTQLGLTSRLMRTRPLSGELNKYNNSVYVSAHMCTNHIHMKVIYLCLSNKV